MRHVGHVVIADASFAPVCRLRVGLCIEHARPRSHADLVEQRRVVWVFNRIAAALHHGCVVKVTDLVQPTRKRLKVTEAVSNLRVCQRGRLG